MSSKFSSPKRWPRAPAVCHAPVPGMPQPNPGPPQSWHAGLWYIRSDDPSQLQAYAQVQMLPHGLPGEFNGRATTTTGDQVLLEMKYYPATQTWDAAFILPAHPGPGTQAIWPGQPPTTLNPWYQSATSAATLSNLVFARLSFTA